MSDDRGTIMIVDDNMTNLATGKAMLKDYYKVYPVPSAEIMFDLLENVLPDLILLDIEMPEMDGYDALKKLKDSPQWEQIPVIFLTQKIDEDSELQGLSMGAIDYVTKPFSAPLLVKRIENHLLADSQRKHLKRHSDSLTEIVRQKNEQVIQLQNAVLSAVTDLVEFRDNVTGGHIIRTQQYLKLLVDKMLERGLYLDEASAWDLTYLLPSAQLHDVGKIAISDAILNKADKLSPEEFEIMKTHVNIGVQLIKKIENLTEEHSFLRHAGLIAGGHHEKWDGSGYPVGLKGMDIPLEGRLMAIADVYDALVSIRPYKRPFSSAEARKIIEEGSGTHFDPELVKIFSEVANQFSGVVRKYAWA
ncbi:MAG: response regulator [Synergistaceae bacterium]|jgi:putative two-component system response regulator|nr:response regulator [Synergistaceae bacterium]